MNLMIFDMGDAGVEHASHAHGFMLNVLQA